MIYDIRINSTSYLLFYVTEAETRSSELDSSRLPLQSSASSSMSWAAESNHSKEDLS